MSVPEPKGLSRICAQLLAVVATAAFFAALASDASAAPTIRFRGNGLDRFKFHGRVKLDPPSLGGPVDPVTSGFRFDLSNQYGLVYGASLYPGISSRCATSTIDSATRKRATETVSRRRLPGPNSLS